MKMENHERSRHMLQRGLSSFDQLGIHVGLHLTPDLESPCSLVGAFLHVGVGLPSAKSWR